MKISVITGRFGISGVPLAQLRFARALSAYGHNVDYMIGYVNEGNKIPEINSVNVYVFNKLRVSNMLIPLIHYFRREKPDIVFTAGDHLNAIVTLAVLISGSKTKISASSRVTPFDTYSNNIFSKGWVLKQFTRALIPRINALTCVSKDMVEQYRQVFKNPPHVSVYNIINDSISQKRMMEPLDDEYILSAEEPIIIAAGMLEPWKGFNDLIMAMKELLKSRKAKLLILGEGSMRSELQELIETLELKSVVKLAGHVENPLKYFKNADVFILSSYVEGLPNVLVEAMMCGCTPVSTDCPTGPSEVLQDGKYGYLVPVKDPVSMAEAIVKALDSPIAKSLLDEAIQPFSEDVVIKRHFEILGINDPDQNTDRLRIKN